MSADFQLAYDPCVCFFNSSFFLTFDFVKSDQMKLYERTTETAERLTQNHSGGSTIIDNGFIAQMDMSSGSIKNGLITYHQTQFLIDDYIDKLELEYQSILDAGLSSTKIYRELILAKAVRQIVSKGIEAVIGKDVITDLKGVMEEYYFTDTSELTKKKVNQMFDLLEKNMSQKLNIYINKNFDVEALPFKSVAPTIAYENMEIKGGMYIQPALTGGFIFTPGSFNSSPNNPTATLANTTNYPIYNNPTGIFALLKEPKLKMSQSIIQSLEKTGIAKIDSVIKLNPLNWNQKHVKNYVNNYLYQEWTKEYQFQLVEDLQFKINQTLDIESYDVAASIILEPTYSSNIENFKNKAKFSYDRRMFTSYTDVENTVNMHSDIDEVENDYKNLTIGPNFVNDQGETYIREYEDTDLMKLGFSSHKPGTFRTPYIPVDALKPFVSSVAIKNALYLGTDMLESEKVFMNNQIQSETKHAVAPLEFLSYDRIEDELGIKYIFNDMVLLKLKVDVVFKSYNDKGVKNRGSYLFTYRIDPTSIQLVDEELIPHLAQSNSNITQYPENMFLKDKTFGGDEVAGCQLIGNEYICRAWNDITLSGNLTALPGYSVRFLAGNEINQIENLQLTGNITSGIESILNYSSPMHEFTNSELFDYCKGNNPDKARYLANWFDPSLPYQPTPVAPDQSDSPADRKFDFYFYPNPSTDQVLVQFNQSLEIQDIKMTNVLGQKIEFIYQVSPEGIEIQLKNFSPGMYLVNINTAKGSVTKSFIKL